ncbi:BMP family ABC transporter substrate-binding protein [Oceanobacillus piezotolerans]|uniref:BMP family ABC transporter substrate-binding protein n=2 Tax=Oceanobacillus piezotolerans TaxID=2448030 RepID=A0A498D768_9BACI|nr:BMP family ABC transporter substrate-binding protein [Oceanobacillus piezotolerans]
MLLDGRVNDTIWNKKGYEGLIKIENKYDIDVFYKENVDTEEEIRNAVDEFAEDGVNLVFGHSNIYGDAFTDLSKYYPDIHFVYFNGEITNDNVTSLNFNAHAMGFFGGMVAGKMTETNVVGIIGSFLWQPEIEGFYEGVKYINPQATLEIDYLKSWKDTEMAESIYERMKNDGADVFYPAGDAFSEKIIMQAEADGLYAIGYISDQRELAPDTVLTSTIQDVDKLYELAAKSFNKGKLKGEIMTFDFQEEVISMGEYHEDIPEYFKRDIKEAIEKYKETELLPNEY